MFFLKWLSSDPDLGLLFKRYIALFEKDPIHFSEAYFLTSNRNPNLGNREKIKVDLGIISHGLNSG